MRQPLSHFIVEHALEVCNSAIPVYGIDPLKPTSEEISDISRGLLTTIVSIAIPAGVTHADLHRAFLRYAGVWADKPADQSVQEVAAELEQSDDLVRTLSRVCAELSAKGGDTRVSEIDPDLSGELLSDARCRIAEQEALIRRLQTRNAELELADDT